MLVVPESPAARFSERVLEPSADVPVLMFTHIIPAPKSDANEQALIGEVHEGGYRGQVTVGRDLDRRVLGTGTPTPRPTFRPARDSVRLVPKSSSSRACGDGTTVCHSAKPGRDHVRLNIAPPGKLLARILEQLAESIEK